MAKSDDKRNTCSVINGQVTIPINQFPAIKFHFPSIVRLITRMHGYLF